MKPKFFLVTLLIGDPEGAYSLTVKVEYVMTPEEAINRVIEDHVEFWCKAQNDYTPEYIEKTRKLAVESKIKTFEIGTDIFDKELK